MNITYSTLCYYVINEKIKTVDCSFKKMSDKSHKECFNEQMLSRIDEKFNELSYVDKCKVVENVKHILSSTYPMININDLDEMWKDASRAKY